MPESAYDRMRRERCKWCAAGSDAGLVAGKRIHQLGSSSTALKPCTAPSLEAWAEELAGKLEQAREALGKLWKHTAKIDNGRCAFCRVGYMSWIFRNKTGPSEPGPCDDDRCLSHVIDAALRALSAEPEAGK